MMALHKRQVILLWTFQFLFLLRVLGQVQVALHGPAWLPPMDEWQSGLMPYSTLLTSQIMILMLMTVISYDNTRKSGFFYVSKPSTKKILIILSTIYFLAMVTRYMVRMAIHPEARWLGGTIPIFFHWILAGYLYLLTKDSDEPHRVYHPHSF